MRLPNFIFILLTLTPFLFTQCIATKKIEISESNAQILRNGKWEDKNDLVRIGFGWGFESIESVKIRRVKQLI